MVKEYVLRVTPDDLRVVSAGLNELPRKLCHDLFTRLQAQVTRQDQEDAAAEAKQGPAPAAPPKPKRR